VDSLRLCEAIKAHGHKEVICMDGMESIVTYLKDVLRPGDLLLTLGAGDVWKVGMAVLKELRG